MSQAFRRIAPKSHFSSQLPEVCIPQEGLLPGLGICPQCGLRAAAGEGGLPAFLLPGEEQRVSFFLFLFFFPDFLSTVQRAVFQSFFFKCNV